MTARDTHELRLEHWPRLSTFPTTAALVVAVIGLDYLTYIAWAVLMALHGPPAPGVSYIPDGWFLFLTGVHAGAGAHFGIKRKTWDPKRGATESNGGSRRSS